MKDSYRPLPYDLTISESPIDGLGVFTKKNIPIHTDFGINWMVIHGEKLRINFGGFVNGGSKPNCIVYNDPRWKYEAHGLLATEDISEGQELVLDYAKSPDSYMYQIKDSYNEEYLLLRLSEIGAPCVYRIHCDEAKLSWIESARHFKDDRIIQYNLLSQGLHSKSRLQALFLGNATIRFTVICYCYESQRIGLERYFRDKFHDNDDYGTR